MVPSPAFLALANDHKDALLRNPAFGLLKVLRLLAAGIHQAAVKIVPGFALLNFTVNVSPTLSVKVAP